MRTPSTAALLAALVVLAACGPGEDLTVAVAEDARGARIDAAPGAEPVPMPEEHVAVAGAERSEAAARDGDGPDGDTVTAEASSTVALAPAAGEDAPVALPEKPAATADDDPAMPLGDLPTAADEVPPPAVDEPTAAVREEPLDGPEDTGDEWKPEPPKPPVLKDGEWNTSFDYLGSFDVGLDAIAADSPMAQHTPRMPEQEGAPEPEKGIPEAVRKMDGQKVRIEGYMIPLKFEDGAVKTFFLSRYMMGCCFGVLPRANEVIEVEMQGDKGAYYDAYMPFVVVGTFEIVEEGTSPEFLQSVFRIKADSADYAEDW